MSEQERATLDWRAAWASEVERANRAEYALRDMVNQAEAATRMLNSAEKRHNQDPNRDTAPFFVDMRLAQPVFDAQKHGTPPASGSVVELAALRRELDAERLAHKATGQSADELAKGQAALRADREALREALRACMVFFNTIDLAPEDFVIGYDGNPATDFNVKDVTRLALVESEKQP